MQIELFYTALVSACVGLTRYVLTVLTPLSPPPRAGEEVKGAAEFTWSSEGF